MHPSTSHAPQTEYIVEEDDHIIEDILEDEEYVDQVVEGEEIYDGQIMTEEHYIDDEGNEIFLAEDSMVGAVEEVVPLTGDVIVQEDDMASESLMALSQGQHKMGKNMEMRYSEIMQKPRQVQSRILRRTWNMHPMRNRTMYYETQTQMRNAPRHNFPLPQTSKRLLPVAIEKPHHSVDRNGDWRIDQRRALDIHAIYDTLPDNMKDSFRQIVEAKAVMPPMQWPAQETAGGLVHPDQIPHEYDNEVLVEAEDVLYKEESSAHADMQDDRKDIEMIADMPRLERLHDDIAPTARAPNDAHVDVEGYDSGDDPDMRDVDEYLVEAGENDYYPPRRGLHHRHSDMVMSEMRDDYYGGMDPNHFSQHQMMNTQIPDARVCPGCKMTLKRSIFYHHSRMIRKFGACNIFTPKRFPCADPSCDQRLGTVEKLCEHMYQIHGAPTEIKTKILNSDAEFDEFLHELEGKGGNFRMSRGNKQIKTGFVQYFRCNRLQSMAKDRTTRIFDELNGIIKEDTREDPFRHKGHVSKPWLRTEEACTAFFRKAFLADGTLEVRYCDHHLHDDERVRLPQPIKDRIHQMHNKRLPPPVIMMVLQSERDKYCQLGSAIERRILTLTPRDISNILATRSGRPRKRVSIPPVVQRERAAAAAAETQEAAALEAQMNAEMEQERQYNGEQLIEDMGDDAVTKSEIMLMDQQQVEHQDDYDEYQLTELEQQMLETFEQNQEVILTDMQKFKRIENKKRNMREHIRNEVFALGRYIKSMTFANMNMDTLEDFAAQLRVVSEITRHRGVPDSYPLHIPTIKGELRDPEILEEDDGQRASNSPQPVQRPPQRNRAPRKRKVVHQPEPHLQQPSRASPVDQGGNIDVVGTSEEVVVDGVVHENVDVVNVSDVHEHEEQMEQIVVDDTPNAAKKARRTPGRPRGPMKKEIKKEAEDEEELVEANMSPRLQSPTFTRTGRLVRPKNLDF